MTERRRIGIEALLRWAFRDELPKEQPLATGLHVGPKQFGQAWGGVSRYGDLLTVTDGGENQWGLVPDFGARSEAHPDAVRVGDAVFALDGSGFDLPDGWNPLDDMHVPGGEDLLASAVALGAARATMVALDGRRALKDSPRRLLVRHALLGDAGPDWEGETPSVQVERHANGTPRWYVRETLTGETGAYEVEVDGFDRKRRGPKPGAYQRRFLDPDPVEVVVGRAVHEAWRLALDIVADELAAIPHRYPDGTAVTDDAGRPVTGLESFEVVRSTRPFRPWAEDAYGVAIRVLPDLAQRATEPVRRAHTITSHYGASRRGS